MEGQATPMTVSGRPSEMNARYERTSSAKRGVFKAFPVVVEEASWPNARQERRKMRSGIFPAVRIASLLPSATEIVCALGSQAQLVGRSPEGDFPAGIEALPVLTPARIEPLPSSQAID